MYWLNVCHRYLNTMSDNVGSSEMPIAYALQCFEHVDEGCPVPLLFFWDLGIILPVTVDCLTLLHFLKRILTRVQRDGSNSILYWLIVHKRLLTCDLVVNYGR